jgi:hypothetical protein
MTPQERQMIDDLFDRLGKVETAPRDPDAAAAIADGLQKAPNAVYALVQTVLVQDEALRRANAHIQELEAAQAPHQQPQPAGFLDSMRETLFGSSSQPHGSVPSVPPPQSRPVWNNGQVMNQAQPPGQAAPPYGQPAYSPSYGGSMFGGGGSFLGTAAAAAAGMVGGSLMLNSIRSMMGGQHFGIGNPAAFGGVATTPGASPWSDQSNSDLARDAGINDIGSSHSDTNDSSRSGLLDQASGDQLNDQDDQTSSDDGSDDMNADDNNFGDDDRDSGNDDDGSDFA